ncbi:MAG: sulfur carrier protein ThiS [Crocinitomicaceae bacterium]
MIEISVNNSLQNVKSNTTLAALLAEILPNSNGTAIALNEQVIPQANWPNKTLEDNDKVLIITATQGG